MRNKSTKSEIKLWKELKGRRMRGYDFHRQKPLLNYIADFYCYELKLVIELDGLSHQLEEVQKKDSIKTKDLENLGLTVLRFQDSEVFKDMANVLRVINHHVDCVEGL